jgi:hypothetical protein
MTALARPGLLGGVWRRPPGLLGGVWRRPPLVGDASLAAADFRAGALPSGVTFTRASPGTFWTGSGALAEVGDDVARFDHTFLTGSPLGLLLESSVTNYVLNPRGEGLAPGTPGTLPANWMAAAGALLTETSALTINNIPGVVMRFAGTPGGTGPQTITWSSGGALPAGGTVGAVYVRMLAGSLLNVSSDAGTVLRVLTTGATTPLATLFLSTLASGQIARPSLYRVAAGGETLNVRWNYLDTVTPVDFTWWFGYPQLQQPATSAASLTSDILPPVASPAASTRAAESAALAVSNGTYDVLVQDTAGGEWRAGEVVGAGSYAITPRSGQRHVRRVRLYAPGTAAANPGWAVAA